jgi:hypothetical protein
MPEARSLHWHDPFTQGGLGDQLEILAGVYLLALLSGREFRYTRTPILWTLHPTPTPNLMCTGRLTDRTLAEAFTNTSTLCVCGTTNNLRFVAIRSRFRRQYNRACGAGALPAPCHDPADDGFYTHTLHVYLTAICPLGWPVPSVCTFA